MTLPTSRLREHHYRYRCARTREALGQPGSMTRKDEPVPTPASLGTVEYLYGTRVEWPEDGPEIRETVPFRVTRKTAKRVYYVRQQYRGGRETIGFVDRDALERDGEVTRRSGHWWEEDSRLFATLDAAEEYIGIGRHAPKAPDLAQMKQEMADAHPDRGGTAEEFIAARDRYERAVRASAPA